MPSQHPALQIDPQEVCQQIEALIHDVMENLTREGAVIGLSGGLDSAVAAALTVRSIGAGRVHLLNLPERDSQPIHRQHAKLLADHFGIPLSVIPITRILKAAGTYRLLPLRFVPGLKLRTFVVEAFRSKIVPPQKDILALRLKARANSWLARANAYAIAKHRLRMMVIYQYAEVRNLMVVGAANRTEWLTGTFSKWGIDHCADMMPLLHLYRTQVEELASCLEEIPDFIRTKAADPDIMPGVNNKDRLLGNFYQVDAILQAVESGADLSALGQTFDSNIVEKILTLYKFSDPMRESPYGITD